MCVDSKPMVGSVVPVCGSERVGLALLAVIEFAWSAAVMALEKTDLQSWTSALIRKIMWLGAFYALLLYGRQWIPAIIDSFSQLGGNAAGINGNNGLSPSDVFTQG